MSLPASSFAFKHAGTALKRLVRNAWTAWRRPPSGWSPPPVLVVLRPTERCNLRCRMCFDRGAETVSESWRSAPPRPDLSAADYHALIPDLARFSPTFYLTGGEPLLAEVTAPILSEIKGRGLYASLNTNGVRLKDWARELVDVGLDRLIVSLDGPREVHDAIRGATFEAVAEGLAAVRERKRKRGVRAPCIRAQCVISPYNAGALRETVAAARALGVEEIRFQHLMFAFSGAPPALDDFLKTVAVRARFSLFRLEPGALDVARLESDVRALRADRGRAPTVGFEPALGTRDLRGYYTDPAHPFCNLCLSPWRRLVVSSSGEMGPCQCFYLGRYPEMVPRELWWGERFRAVRRRMIERGLFAHCLRCCHREYYPPRLSLTVN